VTLREIGFAGAVVARDRPAYALWAVGTKSSWPEDRQQALARMFLPAGALGQAAAV
jgi:hypothetical protein